MTKPHVVAAAIAVLAVPGVAVAYPNGYSTAPKVKVVTANVTQARLVGVIVQKRPAIDRIVFTFAGALPGFNVRYVPEAIQDGSGAVVPLKGTAVLSIRFEPSAAHTVAGKSTSPGAITPLFPAVRQVRRIGDFEGIVSYAAGIAKKPAFCVGIRAAARQIVVDVKH